MLQFCTSVILSFNDNSLSYTCHFSVADHPIKDQVTLQSNKNTGLFTRILDSQNQNRTGVGSCILDGINAQVTHKQFQRWSTDDSFTVRCKYLTLINSLRSEGLHWDDKCSQNTAAPPHHERLSKWRWHDYNNMTSYVGGFLPVESRYFGCVVLFLTLIVFCMLQETHM